MQLHLQLPALSTLLLLIALTSTTATTASPTPRPGRGSIAIRTPHRSISSSSSSNSIFRRAEDQYGEYDEACYNKSSCGDMFSGAVVASCGKQSADSQGNVDFEKAAQCLCGNRQYTELIKNCFACYKDKKVIRQEYIDECKDAGVTLKSSDISAATTGNVFLSQGSAMLSAVAIAVAVAV